MRERYFTRHISKDFTGQSNTEILGLVETFFADRRGILGVILAPKLKPEPCLGVGRHYSRETPPTGFVHGPLQRQLQCGVDVKRLKIKLGRKGVFELILQAERYIALGFGEKHELVG